MYDCERNSWLCHTFINVMTLFAVIKCIKTSSATAEIDDGPHDASTISNKKVVCDSE